MNTTPRNFRRWSDKRVKQELLRRLEADEPRPRTWGQGTDDEFEIFLAEKLAAFTASREEDEGEAEITDDLMVLYRLQREQRDLERSLEMLQDEKYSALRQLAWRLSS